MSPAPQTDEPPLLDDETIQRALAALVDIAMSIAHELKAPDQDTKPILRANAIERVALTVRRTIILSQHLKQNAAISPETRRTQARKEVIRAVEDTIERKADKAETENLRVELLERLDSPEFEADLVNRSPADLILELCRDLGLALDFGGHPTHKRRTPDDVAILCAQAAAAAGSGLPQWLAAAIGQAAQNDIRLKEH